LNTLSLSSSALKSFKVEFAKADSIPIYGFNFDDGKGVHVDNFSSRGNSGLPISLFNTDLMHQFQEKLGYDLIILHFGTNVLNYGTYSYDWYEKRMTRVVNHIKECFPGVTILVVSTADKSTKYDLEMQTDSAVVPLTLAQRKYAVQSNSAYFNLFQAMGGEGSMVKWVDEEVPPLANKDYTHFNYKGSQKVASLLHDQIQKGYEQYKMMRSKRKINVQPKIKSQPIDTVTPKNQTIDAK
ncbi:GDSL-type esterase/lipase family protein, partial [Flavobacterium sp.]|uniref:GDSL-type esterase/lipase family protein n=1 Tax=Flavobacterium sp. TaxID=239 RepID=UPI0037BEE2F3